jgi:hypothetical protein
VVAARTGRPAKMRYDRDDDFVVTGKRHDARIDYRVGVDGDGRLLAVDFTQMIRCGWSMDLSLPVADRAMLHADNAYLLPNARITSHRLKDEHPKRHGLSRLRRAAGDGRDRARDGSRGARAGQGPAGGAAAQLLRRGAGARWRSRRAYFWER